MNISMIVLGREEAPQGVLKMCTHFLDQKRKIAFRKAPLNLVIHLLVVLVTVVVIETIISSGY